MSLLPWKEATIVGIERKSSSILQLELCIPGEPLLFKPGQFLTLDLPIHERPNKRWRSYSIASIPNGSDRCTLLIERCPDGPATQHLFEQVKLGQTLICRGPQGTFYLPDTLDRPILMVADGIGMVPFSSMLQGLACNNNPLPPIRLIFLTSSETQDLFEASLNEWGKSIPDFEYICIDGQSSGEKLIPFIHETLDQWRDPLVYLCGWRNTVDSVRAHLTQRGMHRKEVHVELFG
jgi:ferredoxin-NADP reductase